MVRKYNLEIIGYINTFENLTKARVKDCYIDKNKQLVFIVEQGEAGKAIGKAGKNINTLNKILDKKIKVIEFNSNVVKFIENAIYPLKAEISQENNTITITANGPRLKALLIGRDQQNLKALQDLVSKYFDVEIRVR